MCRSLLSAAIGAHVNNISSESAGLFERRRCEQLFDHNQLSVACAHFIALELSRRRKATVPP